MSVRPSRRPRHILSVLTAAAVVAVSVMTTVPSAQALLTYRIGDYTEVNVRNDTTNPLFCADYPSTQTCPDVVNQVNAGQTVYVICQKRGEVVNENPYWLLVEANRSVGWMASSFIDYPLDRLPDVPDCL